MESHATVPGRRLFLLSGLGLASLHTSTASPAGPVFRFATKRCEIHVTVEFHDRYSSRGFWFNNQASDGRFCLSLDGVENRNCAASFVGSIAIARYEIRSHADHGAVSTLREYVRNIDRDERLEFRPPFHRRIELQGGVASDIQAFGYQENGHSQKSGMPPNSASPWYYFRQDLYLESDRSPFLIIHWKHALSAIRMLDIIPAGETLLVSG